MHRRPGRPSGHLPRAPHPGRKAPVGRQAPLVEEPFPDTPPRPRPLEISYTVSFLVPVRWFKGLLDPKPWQMHGIRCTRRSRVFAVDSPRSVSVSVDATAALHMLHPLIRKNAGFGLRLTEGCGGSIENDCGNVETTSANWAERRSANPSLDSASAHTSANCATWVGISTAAANA